MQNDSDKVESKETEEKHNQQDYSEASQNNADELLNKFIVRYAKPADINFIKKTWLYSLYNGNFDFKRMKKDIFMREYSHVIDSILIRPDTFVKVAHLPDDQDIIISYAVVSYKENFNVLHFVYTKKMWRGMDAHVGLIPQYEYYSHNTKQWEKVCPRGPTYNPFLR